MDGVGVGGLGDLLVGARLDARALLALGVAAHTQWHVECVRAGRRIWTEDFPNRITNVGRAYILQRAVKGQTIPNVFASGLYHDGRVVPAKWLADTAMQVGDVVRPTDTGAGQGRFYICVARSGDFKTHATTEPTWPTTKGGTVVDDAVTWQEGTSLYIGLKGAASDADADTMGSHGGWTEFTSYSGNRKEYVPGTITGTTTATCDNSGNVAVFTCNVTGPVTAYGAFLTDAITAGGTVGLLYGVGDFSQERQLVNNDLLNVTVTTTLS